MSATIVKSGTIGGRGFCIVERRAGTGYGWGGVWPALWFCGYVDATDSRFDGIDDPDGMTAGLGVEITYTGQGVPACDGAPSTGWWIGFDTAHPGMEDETAESVEETIRGLVRAMGKEVRT